MEISRGLCGNFGGNYLWRGDPRPCPAEEQGIYNRQNVQIPLSTYCLLNRITNDAQGTPIPVQLN